MHAAVLQLAPILGAEKSKVPFYIAGGALVAWALIVSVGLGLRKPDFPGTRARQRGVIAVDRRARAGGREHGGDHLGRAARTKTATLATSAATRLLRAGAREPDRRRR